MTAHNLQRHERKDKVELFVMDGLQKLHSIACLIRRKPEQNRDFSLLDRPQEIRSPKREGLKLHMERELKAAMAMQNENDSLANIGTCM